jgi:peroxiredoxin
VKSALIGSSTKVGASASQVNRKHWQKEENKEMAKRYDERIFVATLLILIIVVLLTPLPARALNIGDKAPDFLAFSTIGETVRLSDYQGKKNIMLFFFVRAFGGVWTNETLAFQLDLPKFESLDTQVLGVSVDHIGAQNAFAEKLGLTYPLLDDFSRDIVKRYGVMEENPNSALFRYSKRAYFVIDKQGIVRYRHVMDQVGHLLDSEEILAAVTKVASGK